MSNPLVSIICLCYNQGRFVRETVLSVINQTYPDIELIIVDDKSSDDSVDVISQLVKEHPQIKFLQLESNVGNCKAFNQGFKLSTGAFVLDLAADDVLIHDRIEKQVRYFQQLDPSYGVIFTDATYIDESGKFLNNHYESLRKKRLLTAVPTGDVYKDIISRYFICTPTMLSRREVFEVLNGYDETLSYEDFDFCVRASRVFKFAFLDAKLTKVRRVKKSMSTGWYEKNDRQLHSTFLICKKIRSLNRSVDEDDSLVTRLKFELRQSVFSENHFEARLFFGMLDEMRPTSFADRLMLKFSKLKLPLAFARKLYHKLRYY
jgi:glycosyltransferase involved in cell wall biosynthesis